MRKALTTLIPPPALLTSGLFVFGVLVLAFGGLLVVAGLAPSPAGRVTRSTSRSIQIGHEGRQRSRGVIEPSTRSANWARLGAIPRRG